MRGARTGPVHQHAPGFDPFLQARAAVSGELPLQEMIQTPAGVFFIHIHLHGYFQVSNVPWSALVLRFRVRSNGAFTRSAVRKSRWTVDSLSSTKLKRLRCGNRLNATTAVFRKTSS